jgi:enoyl-CoA hydratase/carnithine racemase
LFEEHVVTQDSILVERRGGVGWITLNRPKSVNAIDDSIRHGLPTALRELDADPAIRAIVVRGGGTRGFCAGADIKEQRAPETPLEAHRRMADNPWIEAFAAVSTPIIAAIHGICMGGGFEIALACDIRMASADAVFALPETGLGLIPGAGGTQRLPRIVGIGVALDLTLSNEQIDAAEAKRLNIVTRLHADPESLFAAAAALAERIAANPPMASSFARRAVAASAELALDEGIALERDLFALLLTTEDRLEAAIAFREKRAPRFTGR